MPVSVDVSFTSGLNSPVVKYTFVIDSDLHVFRNGEPYTGPILEDHQWMSNAPIWECDGF
jgi:hypothetical protein